MSHTKHSHYWIHTAESGRMGKAPFSWVMIVYSRYKLQFLVIIQGFSTEACGKRHLLQARKQNRLSCYSTVQKFWVTLHFFIFWRKVRNLGHLFSLSSFTNCSPGFLKDIFLGGGQSMTNSQLSAPVRWFPGGLTLWIQIWWYFSVSNTTGWNAVSNHGRASTVFHR